MIPNSKKKHYYFLLEERGVYRHKKGHWGLQGQERSLGFTDSVGRG